MHKKKTIVYKGTDEVAFKKARRKGGTPQQMSENYYIEKRKNEEKRYKKLVSKKINYTVVRVPKTNTIVKKVKYTPKETILDVIRKYRSPKFTSYISNCFSTIMVRAFGKQLNDNEKDLVRSVMALVISETLNRALEKPLKVIDNIKMFIKLGKTVYKVILKFNEYAKEYEIDANNVFKVDEKNSEYQSFLLKHPELKNKYELISDLNAKRCPLCNSKVELIIEENKEFYVCSNYLNETCKYKILKK